MDSLPLCYSRLPVSVCVCGYLYTPPHIYTPKYTIYGIFSSYCMLWHSFWKLSPERSGYPTCNVIAVLWFLGLASPRKGPNPVRTVGTFAVEVGIGWGGLSVTVNFNRHPARSLMYMSGKINLFDSVKPLCASAFFSRFWKFFVFFYLNWANIFMIFQAGNLWYKVLAENWWRTGQLVKAGYQLEIRFMGTWYQYSWNVIKAGTVEKKVWGHPRLHHSLYWAS